MTMRLFPQELYIMRLKGRVPGHSRLAWLGEMSREECIRELKKLSGVDIDPDF